MFLLIPCKLAYSKSFEKHFTKLSRVSTPLLIWFDVTREKVDFIGLSLKLTEAIICNDYKIGILTVYEAEKISETRKTRRVSSVTHIQFLFDFSLLSLYIKNCSFYIIIFCLHAFCNHIFRLSFAGCGWRREATESSDEFTTLNSAFVRFNFQGELFAVPLCCLGRAKLKFRPQRFSSHSVTLRRLTNRGS